MDTAISFYLDIGYLLVFDVVLVIVGTYLFGRAE